MRKIRESVHDAQYSVREISEKANRTDDVVRFDIGQPDFDTPPAAREAAREALDRHITYTDLWGIPPLREEIAAFESRKADYSADDVMVTTGGIGALYSIFSTIAEPGDTILCNDPCWSVYPMLLRCSTADFRQTPYFSDGKIDIEGIRDAIDDTTQAIIVNNPENPTGRVYSRDELEAIMELAEAEDLWVIGDEVYDRLTYGKEHVSVAEIDRERSLLVNSMSKNFAMTGWRLGWTVCPDEELLHNLGKLNRSTTACPNFVSQHAAIGALRGAQEYVDEMRAAYRERRDIVQDELDSLGLDYVSPDGAIYIFPDVGRDSWEFAHELLDEAGVAVVPGAPSGSGSSTNVRICFGSVEKDAIREGMRRMEAFLD